LGNTGTNTAGWHNLAVRRYWQNTLIWHTLIFTVNKHITAVWHHLTVERDIYAQNTAGIPSQLRDICTNIVAWHTLTVERYRHKY
jgi:hypothetical protein